MTRFSQAKERPRPIPAFVEQVPPSSIIGRHLAPESTIYEEQPRRTNGIGNCRQHQFVNSEVETAGSTLQASSALEATGVLLSDKRSWRREALAPDAVTSNPSIALQKARLGIHEKIGHQMVADRSLMQPPARVAIKDNRRITIINIRDIVSIEAQGNYVLLHYRDGSTMLREAISTVASKLEAHGFIRIHRSVLINTVHVESVEMSTGGDYRVMLSSDRNYTVSRSYRANLAHLAPIWIGPFVFERQRRAKEESDSVRSSVTRGRNTD